MTKPAALCGLLVLLLLLMGPACKQQPMETVPGPPPNILLAIADDWSWPHAGAYGDPVVTTPTFDRIAREGVLFDHAFVASPSCTPSRAAILTGQWHWRLQESANLWSTLRSDIPVYPDILESHGYFAGYTGKGWGPGRFEVGGRHRNPAGNQFDSFSDFLAQRPPGQPFVFWFGSSDPHRPYDQGAGEAGGIDLERVRLPRQFPDSKEIRGDVADYFWEVQRFDREVGELLAQLEKIEELDTTLIVMTSDNGMPFPRSKGNLYDAGTRVPLALRSPGDIPAGRILHDLVSLTDLAPTFLESAGLVPPDVMTGRSLRNLLHSGASGWIEPERNAVLSGKERHVPCQEDPDSGGTPMRSIRTRDYLYIRNFRPDRWPAGTPNFSKAFFPGSWYGDCDNSPTKSVMIDSQNVDTHHQRLFQLAFSKRPAEELYELQNDPDQLVNVAADPAYETVRQQLAQRLETQLIVTRDPRLSGGANFDDYPYYGGSPLHPDYRETVNGNR